MFTMGQTAENPRSEFVGRVVFSLSCVFIHVDTMHAIRFDGPAHLVFRMRVSDGHTRAPFLRNLSAGANNKLAYGSSLLSTHTLTHCFTLSPRHESNDIYQSAEKLSNQRPASIF